MQLTIDVKNISQFPNSDLAIEIIEENNPDYKYIAEGRERREKGEKTYSIDEVMNELNSFPLSRVGMHT